MKSEILAVMNKILHANENEKNLEYITMLGYISDRNDAFHEKWFLDLLRRTEIAIECKFRDGDEYLSTQQWNEIIDAIIPSSDIELKDLLQWFSMKEDHISMVDVVLKECYLQKQFVNLKIALHRAEKQDILNVSEEFKRYIGYLMNRFSDEEMSFVETKTTF